MIYKSKNLYNKMNMEQLKETHNSDIMSALSDLKLGIFVWDYNKSTCFVNEYILERFHVSPEQISSLQDILLERVDENSFFLFIENIYKIRSDNAEKIMKFPVKSNQNDTVFHLQLSYVKENDTTVGIITNLEQTSSTIIGNGLDNSIFKETLRQIQMPLSIVSKDNEVVFCNFDLVFVHKDLYKIIDSVHSGENDKVKTSMLVQEVLLIDKQYRESTFNVKYRIGNKWMKESITRSVIKYQGDDFFLYTHHKLIQNTEEQQRLRKILRANELILEIRDIIDYVDDLNEMFNFLLSKIHTVIPEANRCCILRVTGDDMLYLDASYGFNEEYVDGFKLPFKNSFAFTHLKNNYSKSVIINDIQSRYSNLFPDIKGDETRFSIESNIATPLVIDNHLYGLISVDSNLNHVFDDVDLNLLDYMKIQIEEAIKRFRKYKNIKRDSNEDSLTGVANRRYLLNMIEQKMEIAVSENKSFLFVLFDIDRLKQINDIYGHNYGDRVIKQFAFELQTNMRESDILARIGGDEFVGIFYDVTTEIIDARIQSWMTFFKHNPIKADGKEIYTKFSYGISEFPTEGSYFSDLMEVADKRMYEQKRSKDK